MNFDTVFQGRYSNHFLMQLSSNELQFTQDQRHFVSLDIFSINDQLITHEEYGYISSGEQEITISDLLTSWLYLMRLTTSNGVGKMKIQKQQPLFDSLVSLDTLQLAHNYIELM